MVEVAQHRLAHYPCFVWVVVCYLLPDQVRISVSVVPMKKVFKVRLGNDGAENYLERQYLRGPWEIGEWVKVTIQSVRRKKAVCRKKPGIVLIGS